MNIFVSSRNSVDVAANRSGRLFGDVDDIGLFGRLATDHADSVFAAREGHFLGDHGVVEELVMVDVEMCRLVEVVMEVESGGADATEGESDEIRELSGLRELKDLRLWWMVCGDKVMGLRPESTARR